MEKTIKLAMTEAEARKLYDYLLADAIGDLFISNIAMRINMSLEKL